MKLIALTQGQFAQVDDEDYEKLNLYKWYAHKDYNTFYAMRKDKKKSVYMHCEILNSKGIDHTDGNGLNNQKSNLRICTIAQNGYNQRKQSDCSSKYKGVYWNKRLNKWQTQITFNGKRMYLGLFIDETEAGKAYDVKAIELFGAFAGLNFKD